MNEEEVLPFLCVGGIAFFVIIVISLLIMGSGPMTYRKRMEGQNTCLTVSAKRNLARVCLVAKVGEEDVTFERRRLKKGQSIDFVYPASKTVSRLMIEVEPGNVKNFDV